MEFKEAKAALDAVKEKLGLEIAEWRPLTDALVAQTGTIREKVTGFAGHQQANAQRLRSVAARFHDLGATAVDTGAVSDRLTTHMGNLLSSLNDEVAGLQDELENVVPAFLMSRDPLNEAAQNLKDEFEEKSAALAEALGDRLSEAQAKIEENLSQSVQLLATSASEMSVGIKQALDDAHESLEELWDEASENITGHDTTIASKGDDLKDVLTKVVAGAVDKVTGKLTSLSEAVDGLLSELRRTLDNVERTLGLVGEVSEGTSVGMRGATTSLHTARQIISSVA